MCKIEELLEFSQTLTLLYVEDNLDARAMTVMLLEDYFGGIEVAKNGLEALEIFQQKNVDIVITDITMPKLDGLSLARKIKEYNEEIPVLIFSAYNDVEKFMEAIAIGVDGYLVKPLDLTQLQNSLCKAFKGIKTLRENEQYKKALESKVQNQTDVLRKKDTLLLEQAKFAAMGEMIDIIAHQWKQPLNTVVMHSSYLEECLKSDKKIDYDELAEYFQNVNTQVEYLLHTLNQFRGFFRPNSVMVSTSIKEVIDATLILLKDQLIAHSVVVEVLCTDTLELFVHPNDLKQLFINIINNAKEAMEKDAIAKEKRKITICCKEYENEIVITIADSGKGIPKEIQSEIFTMNFTTKSKSGGTGIGLYMCALICEKYNATIAVDNDNGAVFTMRFLKKH